MRHRVEDDIDAEGVCFLFREFAEVKLVLAFALPAIAVVGVMADDDAQAAFVVVDSADVALLRIVALPCDATVVLTIGAKPDVWDLKIQVGWDGENASEERMSARDIGDSSSPQKSSTIMKPPLRR
jgi:hypothetical protein